MRTPSRKRRPIDRGAAETLAAQALAFLAAEPARLQRFLLATGLELGELRDRAGSREVLMAVLEHLAGDESLLLVFAAGRQVAAESVGEAIVLLQAPDLRDPSDP